jgi:phage terminase large subunit
MPEEIKVQLPKRAFNTSYIDYLDDASRYLVFYGGAGSGKSYFIAERYILHLMQRPMTNILVVRAVGNTNRDSTFALFKQIISKWGLNQLFKVTESDLRITCTNGNSVIFKGLDDSEKLKSITFAKGELTDIWIEEASETLEADFNQLNIRLRGKGTQKQIVISFNPIDINHWLKKRFFDRKDDDVKILHTTYRDNRFLDDEYIALLESYKTTDPYYYDVYCLGTWGVFGDSIFDKNKINERLKKLPEPVKTGSFVYTTEFNETVNEVLIVNDSIKLSEDNGFVTIYKEPIKGVPYVISGDTAGDGSDFFACHVIDNTTGEQVAVLHHQFDEDMFADQVYCLGMYYNAALVGIETNYSTYPAKRLQRLRYPKQYVRERPDTYTGALTESFGWITSSKTRPSLIAEAVQMVRENVDLINDRKTLEEMLTFTRNEKGRPEAAQGCHDDLVISYGIVLSIRGQQTFSIKQQEGEKATWRPDQWDDYRQANAEDKKMLLKLWGNPGI